MISVSMAVEDKGLWEEAHAALSGQVRIDSAQEHVGSLASFAASLEHSCPDIVLFDVSVVRPPVGEVIRKLRAAVPDSMIIALNTSDSARMVLECFRSGADDYLFPPLAEGLQRAVDRRTAESQKRDSANPGGKLVVFLSAKGGAGATTLACHTAAALGRLSGSALLADLDIDSGMVSFLTKVHSPYSVTEALNNVNRLDASYWNALVTHGPVGLDIIPAPTVMAKQGLKLDELRRVLAFMRKQYKWTVADAGDGLNHVTLTDMQSADEACLVTTAEIPALHQTKQVLQKLMDLGYDQKRIRLILNRVDRHSEIKPEDVQGMMPIPVFAVIPEAQADLHEAYSNGQLVQPGTELGNYMERLARKLAGVEERRGKLGLKFFNKVA